MWSLGERVGLSYLNIGMEFWLLSEDTYSLTVFFWNIAITQLPVPLLTERINPTNLSPVLY